MAVMNAVSAATTIFTAISITRVFFIVFVFLVFVFFHAETRSTQRLRGVDIDAAMYGCMEFKETACAVRTRNVYSELPLTPCSWRKHSLCANSAVSAALREIKRLKRLKRLFRNYKMSSYDSKSH